MSKEITEKIFNWFEILRVRPKMIISADIIDYSILKIYIEAYMHGISIVIGKNVDQEITQWYEKKINTQTSYYWTGHIPFHFEGKSDEELKTILLDITQEYFRENPYWYKVQ